MKSITGNPAEVRMLSAVVPRDDMRSLDLVAQRRGVARSELVRAAIKLVLHADAEWLRAQREGRAA